MITLVQAALEDRILGAVVFIGEDEALASAPLLDLAHQVCLVLAEASNYVFHQSFVRNLLRKVTETLAKHICGVIDLLAQHRVAEQE